MFFGFPGGSDGKVSVCDTGDQGLIPRLGRFPGGGHGNPPQYSWLEKPRQEEPDGLYSPWGHKESDRAGQLSSAQHMLTSGDENRRRYS